jgi:hypothetical protein
MTKQQARTVLVISVAVAPKKMHFDGQETKCAAKRASASGATSLAPDRYRGNRSLKEKNPCVTAGNP